MELSRKITSLFVILVLMLFFQHVTSISFVTNELVYLASPYYDIEGIAKSLVFLASYIVSVFLVWISIFVKSRKLWVILLVLLTFCVWIDLFIQTSINQAGFTKAEYALALAEMRSYDNMLMYAREMAYAFIYTLPLIFILVFFRKTVTFRFEGKWLPVFILSVFLLVYGAKQWVYYIKYSSYPAVVKIPLTILDYHLHRVEEKPRILDETIFPAKESEVKNIVWIIDESIGGKYLSINGFNKETTPYLESIINTDIIANYGSVNSVANCSAFSNLFMRIGLSPRTKNAEINFIATRNKLPTIYQYAKRAGYKTWLFDSQADQGQLQNYLTPYDMRHIDKFITLDTRIDDIKRDRLHLEEIAEVLEKDEANKKFIVFVKDGAHWPYLWRYPKEKEIFTPVQATIYEEKTIENKEKLINTYANTVRHTVDDFLKEYMSKVDLKETLTIYTSDHGQNLLDEGANTTLTHCSSDFGLPVSQGEVPLLVIGENAFLRFPVSDKKLYSQYQIFPTVLSLMGYAEDVISNYGNTLFLGQFLSEKRWFYFDMEGSKVPYHQVDKMK
jgi:glucan phosphoethanolaminetransferase (alkaline phosphatase superfamily)